MTLMQLVYLIFTSSSSLCRRSSFSSSSDTSEGFWNKNKGKLSCALYFVLHSTLPQLFVWVLVAGAGDHLHPRGCYIPMWRRQSGQVNPVLFCPLYFLLFHINTSPCGGATCYKSTVHFYFLYLLPTQTPKALDVISRFLFAGTDLILSVSWYQI